MVVAYFPYRPLDLIGDIYLGDQWVPIQLPELPQPGNQLRETPITITRGAPNEQSKPGPSKCTLRLGNRDGRYSPRNPAGPYFEKLKRNVPLRLLVRRERDKFDRIVSTGWGTSTTGDTYQVAGAGGTVLNTDWSVDGAGALHSVPTTLAYRFSRFTNASYQDVQVTVTVDVDAVTNVTGGDLEPANIMLRGSGGDYLMVRLVINSAEEVSIAMMHSDGTTFHSAQTVINGWAGEPLRVKALCEDQAVRVKVWRPGSENEPYDWGISAHVTRTPSAGWVGIRSGVANTNSNSKPVKFRYTDLEVAVPQFAGEITKWPQQTHATGHDAVIAVEASGILRRLGQGATPLRSTLYRGIMSSDSGSLKAYWPAEEGRTATQIASALTGGTAMRVDGTPSFATFSEVPATSPLPELRKSAWTGDVPPYAATGAVQVRWLMKVPSGGTVDQDVFTRVFLDGTVKFVDLMYHVGSGGGLSIKAYDLNGAEVFDTNEIDFDLNGHNWKAQLDLEQVGSNINLTVAVLEPGAPSGGFTSGTLNSYTLGSARQIVINPYKNIDSVGFGQIEVRSVVTSLFDLNQELNAYTGEAAGVRARRLADENGLPFDWYGTLESTGAMGPQRPDKLLTLMGECAAVDGGTLYEPKGVVGLVYRTRASTENQTPVLATSYRNLKATAGNDPLDDDQNTRNQVTVTRKDGSSATSVQLDGPLSVLPPEQGGVGLYDTTVTVNCWKDEQLPYLAAWLRHTGTIDEARYPQLVIDLASPAFAASAALSSAVLALNVDDRLTLTNPPAGQSPDTIDQIARGFTLKMAPWTYELTMNCAPASPYNVLVLDDPLARLAPSPDCALNGAFAAGVSPLSVKSPSGPLWTTDAAQMPIPVRIAGEDMSVTAISGASSPQSFTVTRGLNIAKAQVDGAAVTLSYQPVLGL